MIVKMNNLEEKIKQKLKEADKQVVYTTKADVKAVQDKVKPGTEIHITADDQKTSSMPSMLEADLVEAGEDGVTTVIDDTKPDGAAGKEVQAKMTSADKKTTGFSNKDANADKGKNPENQDEVNKIVTKFIKSIDRSPMAVTAAKQLKTPNLKLAAGVELIKKLRIPRNYLNRLKGLMATAVVQEMNAIHGNLITEASSGDGVFQIGELKELLMGAKNAKDKKAFYKWCSEKGSDYVEMGAAFIAAGFESSIGQQGGDLITGAGKIGSMFIKKLFNSKYEAAKQNQFMALFAIDPQVSDLLDDKIEKEFVQYAVDTIANSPDDTAIVDMFNELQNFIKTKYSKPITKVGIAKNTGESVNPKMKKKDLMELIQSSNKLKVVETIKVKHLKK